MDNTSISSVPKIAQLIFIVLIFMTKTLLWWTCWEAGCVPILTTFFGVNAPHLSFGVIFLITLVVASIRYKYALGEKQVLNASDPNEYLTSVLSMIITWILYIVIIWISNWLIF